MSDHPSVARRFVLLGGEHYYAKGGFNDFVSSHDTLADALAESRRLVNERHEYSIEWWHIWDCATNSIVAKSETQAYGASDSGPTLDGSMHADFKRGVTLTYPEREVLERLAPRLGDLNMYEEESVVRGLLERSGGEA